HSGLIAISYEHHTILSMSSTENRIIKSDFSFQRSIWAHLDFAGCQRFFSIHFLPRISIHYVPNLTHHVRSIFFSGRIHSNRSKNRTIINLERLSQRVSRTNNNLGFINNLSNFSFCTNRSERGFSVVGSVFELNFPCSCPNICRNLKLSFSHTRSIRANCSRNCSSLVSINRSNGTFNTVKIQLKIICVRLKVSGFKLNINLFHISDRRFHHFGGFFCSNKCSGGSRYPTRHTFTISEFYVVFKQLLHTGTPIGRTQPPTIENDGFCF